MTNRLFFLMLAAVALSTPSSMNSQAPAAAIQNPPKIIEGCFTETLTKLGSVCEYWIRIGDTNNYNVVALSKTAGQTTSAHLTRFDRTRIEANLTSVMNGTTP